MWWAGCPPLSVTNPPWQDWLDHSCLPPRGHPPSPDGGFLFPRAVCQFAGWPSSPSITVCTPPRAMCKCCRQGHQAGAWLWPRPPHSGTVREAMLLLWVLQGWEVMLVHLPEELLAQPKTWLSAPSWALPCAHHQGTAGYSVTASTAPLSGGHSVSCSGRLSAWVRFLSVPCLHSGPCRSGCPEAPGGTP